MSAELDDLRRQVHVARQQVLALLRAAWRADWSYEGRRDIERAVDRMMQAEHALGAAHDSLPPRSRKR